MKTISIGGVESVEVSLPEFGTAKVEPGVIYDVPDEALDTIVGKASNMKIYGDNNLAAVPLKFTPFSGSIPEPSDASILED